MDNELRRLAGLPIPKPEKEKPKDLENENDKGRGKRKSKKRHNKDEKDEKTDKSFMIPRNLEIQVTCKPIENKKLTTRNQHYFLSHSWKLPKLCLMIYFS